MPKEAKDKSQKKPTVSYKRPLWGNESAQYWRSLFTSANNARKEGWKRYYEELERADKSMMIVRAVHRTCPASIPKHIKDEYMRMVSQQDQSERECPICTESMHFDDMELTECGHMSHKACLEAALAKNAMCPLCRYKVPMKHWSEESDGGSSKEQAAVAPAQAPAAAEVK